jgi:hypothetical protein
MQERAGETEARIQNFLFSKTFLSNSLYTCQSVLPALYAILSQTSWLILNPTACYSIHTPTKLQYLEMSNAPVKGLLFPTIKVYPTSSLWTTALVEPWLYAATTKETTTSFIDDILLLLPSTYGFSSTSELMRRSQSKRVWIRKEVWAQIVNQLNFGISSLRS